jgi:glutaconyl-CoA/methylmalonyl-CoA decarboxylase subunit gamma
MKLRVTVNGVEYEVEVEILDDRENSPASLSPAPAPSAPAVIPPRPPAVSPPAPASAGGKVLTSPIPGTVVEILTEAGRQVKANEPVIVIDAMKMNTQVASIMEGVIKEILVQPGEPVKMGQALMTYE